MQTSLIFARSKPLQTGGSKDSIYIEYTHPWIFQLCDMPCLFVTLKPTMFRPRPTLPTAFQVIPSARSWTIQVRTARHPGASGASVGGVRTTRSDRDNGPQELGVSYDAHVVNIGPWEAHAVAVLSWKAEGVSPIKHEEWGCCPGDHPFVGVASCALKLKPFFG